MTPKAKGEGGLKQLVFVFRHKEIWPVMLVWCLASISYGFMFTSSVYYAQYILAGQRVDFATMDEAERPSAERFLPTWDLFPWERCSP